MHFRMLGDVCMRPVVAVVRASRNSNSRLLCSSAALTMSMEKSMLSKWAASAGRRRPERRVSTYSRKKKKKKKQTACKSERGAKQAIKYTTWGECTVGFVPTFGAARTRALIKTTWRKNGGGGRGVVGGALFPARRGGMTPREGTPQKNGDTER